MKRSVFLYVIYMFFITSCSNQEGVIGLKTIEAYDSISINIDYPYLHKYVRNFIYRNGDTLFFAGFNHKTYSIDIFDITNKKPQKSIPIEQEGPNAVFNFSKFALNDSVIIFTEYTNVIKVMSRKDGKIINQIRLSQLLAKKRYSIMPQGIYAGGNMPKLQLNGNNLSLPIYSLEEPSMNDTLSLSVDLFEKKVKPNPIKYPQELSGCLNDYLLMIYPYINEYEDRFIYNFPFTSSIYVYNKSDEMTQTYKMDSKQTDNKAKSISIGPRNYQRKYEYDSNMLRFRETYFDKKTNCYFRIHNDIQDENESEQYRNSYLILFNERTFNMKEYLLPKSFEEVYFVENNVIYFFLRSSDDYTINIARIRIEDLK